MWRKRKRQPNDREKIFRITYVTKDSYLEHIKNSQTSTLKEKKVQLNNEQKTWTDVWLKICRWQVHEKMLNIIMHLGNANLNYNEIISHLSEWIKWKQWQHHMLVRMGKNLNYTHILLVRMENGTITLENGLSVSYKTKHSTSNCTLVHLS